MRTTKANKNHGPCPNCGSDIEPGQKLVRTSRYATQEEIKAGQHTTYVGGFGYRVAIKLHESCMQEYFRKIKENNGRPPEPPEWTWVVEHADGTQVPIERPITPEEFRKPPEQRPPESTGKEEA